MNKKRRTRQPVRLKIVRKEGKIAAVTTNSSWIAHFLNLVKVSRTYNTWVNYAYDLKAFFEAIPKTPTRINRHDCVAFIQHQQGRSLSNATINRRLATVSSLFDELKLLDPKRFSQNPIRPQPYQPGARSPNQTLYRRQPRRIPHVIPEAELRAFFEALPTWRDRTLVLLMWISCLRISEAVAIQFNDIECSRRSLRIPQAKGNHSRTVFMNELTFAFLNRYLDEERRDLFPNVNFVFIAFKGETRGRPLSINALQHLLHYYAQKSDLPHIHAHLFRHTGITQLVQQKMAEPALRQLVGHRRPESLLPYLHLSDTFVETEFQAAQEALSTIHQLALSSTGGEP